MDILSNPWVLAGAFGFMMLCSLLWVPRKISVDGFFDGTDPVSGGPRLWTLVLSQVTTWIFARSLMNAAILGYFYGFAGTLAYTAYYLSFLTGAFWVSYMRRDSAGSVQDWIGARFGTMGLSLYNLVVGLRLLSEVFANLIVVGLIFSAAFPAVATADIIAILLVAFLGLLYSLRGGLTASLRTDVIQMLFFLAIFGVSFIMLVIGPDFSFNAIFQAQGVHDQGARPGWILFFVALLQVISYPLHDPVMMDRGFIADETRTKRSFFHAFWISAFCIFGFGMFGIQAGLMGAAYENQLLATWPKMFGSTIYFLIALSLLVSAVSTLDSALSSAARLMIEELYVAKRTLRNGRIVMAIFMVLGVLLTLWENKTLFDAVAVSGTASMFLTPVFLLSWMSQGRLPLWSYVASWVASLLGAAAYMYRDHELLSSLIAVDHKYDFLLFVCVAVLSVGFFACSMGLIFQKKQIDLKKTQ